MVLSKKIVPLYTSIRHHQVTVLGGATDIGQTLCLLLRKQPNITKLIIHDTQPQTMGVSLDLFHIPSNSKVKGYIGEDTMLKSVQNSEIVIAAGGLPRKPGISDSLWLNSNINFIRSLAKTLSKISPMPFIGIVTEPLNILVPMIASILRSRGTYDPRKLFGITNLDVLRAQSLYATDHNLDPRNVFIPVIGGHSDKTCIPLLSQAKPSSLLDSYKAHEFTEKFRKTDDYLMKAKNGFSPVVSVAYSALLFTLSILEALEGKITTVNAFVENNDFGTGYFSGRVHVDIAGIIEMHRYYNLSKYECNLLERCIKHLRQDILRGKKELQYV